MAVVAKCSRRGFFFSPRRAVRWAFQPIPSRGARCSFGVPHGLKTLRPKEENTTQHNRKTISTMKLFCPNCDMTRLDSQIQELTETLAQIDARSNRLLVAMEADGLAVAGDVHA